MRGTADAESMEAREEENRPEVTHAMLQAQAIPDDPTEMVASLIQEQGKAPEAAQKTIPFRFADGRRVQLKPQWKDLYMRTLEKYSPRGTSRRQCSMN